MFELQEGRITANGVDFAYISQGPADGELALCLHGFPDSPASFRPLMAALSEAGYCAVAPYMRGYAPTQVPADSHYQTAALGMDAVALIEKLGAGSTVVIGHDWGAIAAYAAAVIAPQRIRRLVTAAVPYGPGLAMSLITDPAQQRRSWYMYLLAGSLGEMALSFGDFGLVDRLWADWSPGFKPGAAFMRELKQVFAQPGSALAAASYYKQVFSPELHDPALAALQSSIGAAPIEMPALYLHGADDGCIGPEFTCEPSLFKAGLQTVSVPAAGHFLFMEQPDLVNQAVLDFLSAR